MNRLTCKPDKVMKNYYYETTEETVSEDRITILNKLGQLEDIEEELGIDLIILFKALNGIYVFEQNAENEIVWEEVELNIYNKTLDFRHPRKEIGKGRPLYMFGKT